MLNQHHVGSIIVSRTFDALFVINRCLSPAFGLDWLHHPLYLDLLVPSSPTTYQASISVGFEATAAPLRQHLLRLDLLQLLH